MVNIENINILKAALTEENAKKMNFGFNMGNWIVTYKDASQDRLDGCKTTACIAGWCYVLEHKIDTNALVHVYSNVYSTSFKDRDGENMIVGNIKLQRDAADWLGISSNVASCLFGIQNHSLGYLTVENAIRALDMLSEIKHEDDLTVQIQNYYRESANRNARRRGI